MDRRAAVGHVDGAVPAHTAYHGSELHVGSTLTPAGAHISRGGVAYVGACDGILRTTGEACPNAPVEGERFCIGHMRAQKRAEAAAKSEV